MHSVKRFVIAALAALVAVAVPAAAWADPIPGLYNTGIDAAGNRIAENGGEDAHYRVNGMPAYTYQHPAYYPTGDSYWIAQYANGGYSEPLVDGMARTTYTLTFDLTGLNPATARITGSWGVDNYGMILVNGVQHSTNTAGFQSLTAFTITSGFKPGLNTLTFVVDDYGPPAAFVVSGMSGTADRSTPPTWTVGGYGPWSNACGNATRTRTVTCVTPDDGQTVADSRCDAATRPAGSESSYQTSGCGYEWIPSTWSAPVPACGPTTQSRTLSCRRSDGQTVDASMCDPATRPEATQAANDTSTCTFRWTVGQYGAPSTTCGQATQTRSVTCRRSDDTAASDAACDPATRPAESASTYQTSGCGYEWKTGPYGSPAAGCGQTATTREVWCERSDGQRQDDAACTGAKPATQGTGINYDTCSYQWVVDDWGAPSTTCGDATETRQVTCRRSEGTTVPDASCTGAKPDETRQSHQVSGCGHNWIAGAFGAPAPACGPTTRTRTVTCLRTDGQTVDDAACTGAKPATSEPATDYTTCGFAWATGAWSTPSACGTVTRTRDVTCRRTDGTTVADGSCDAATRPASSEAVEDTSSCTYSWVNAGQGAWSACQAGIERRTVSVECRRNDGVRVADGNCTAAKPDVEETRSCSVTPPATTTPVPANDKDVVVFRRPLGQARK